MLQSSEYDIRKYLSWYWTTQDFSKVRIRGNLKKTSAAKILLISVVFIALLEVLIGIYCVYLWKNNQLFAGWTFGLALILGYPIIIANLIIVPLFIARILLVSPSNNRKIIKSEKIFKDFKGEKIAIVGSYGKTSMKELLVSVLGDYKNIAFTPGNKNVAISHANFAFNLKGDEDILLIEYGEGAPKDVELFARITHPTRAIITGLAPAHLDKYKTLMAAGEDIFSVSNFLNEDKVYVNQESSDTSSFLKPKFNLYNRSGIGSWKVGEIKNSLEGISFKMSNGKTTLKLASKLIGRHHIGALVLVASLALELGLSEDQVINGISNTKPYEHRMQPYQLNGATIIDDTYNGNIEGIKAGTELLSELDAKKKFYVTPGLVDQGKETKSVHEKMGEFIAKSDADTVVLMKNSVTHFIEAGLKKGGYDKKVIIEKNPLKFYKNLDQFVASGDVVLMQNDWPDQYK
jgi:UDP-N-acetylmuramoyl-tripeptide--D-alanyl-D-alanine ligase